MKRLLLIMLLVVSMLTMVGFTSVEADYWDEIKEIYEWDAMKGESETEFSISIPDMDIDYQYKIYVNSKSNLDDLSSYSEIKIEDLQGQSDIPVIKMYSCNSDFYINTEAVFAFLSAIDMADGVEIEEEFVLLENNQDDIEIDAKEMLNDIMQLIDEMDLGVDLNMEKEGNTYTLKLESDELVDLLEAYIRYILENIDQLPESLMQGQEIEITEEEKQEMLEEYNNAVNMYKEIVRAFVDGSKFYMQSTFEEGKYSEDSQIKISIQGLPDMDMEIPEIKLNIKTKSVATGLESSDIELPTSVFKITTEELEQLIMDKIGIGDIPKAVIGLDGSYIIFDELDIEEGQISLKVEEGRAYITIKDAGELFGVELENENIEDPFHIRKLDNYGFNVDWNEESRLIEVY